MKILIPLNGTSAAHRVLPFANQLAVRLGAELLFLRAIDPLAFAGESFASLVTVHLEREMLKAAQSYLDTIAAKFPNVLSRSLCLVGPARETIRSVAEREKCNLILMAPYSYGPIARWLVGSMAEQISHCAPCPVMLVRGEAVADPKHVLVPVDGSEASCNVLKDLKPWIGPEARVTVIHCTGVNEDEAGSNHTTHQFLKQLRADLGEKVARYPKAHLEFVSTHSPDGILSWLESSDCDLVAMATHGHGSAEKLYAGSTTDLVARQLDRPLLLFPPASRQVPITVE
ncbi:universal stress protein [bacterium]|nr:universal stress protein [bacterium]